MLHYTHWLIVLGYVTAPIVAVIIAVLGRRRFRLLSKLFAVASTAIVLGSAVSLAYALLVGGNISVGQIGLCIYLTASLILIVMMLDYLLIASLRRVWDRITGECSAAHIGRKIVESLPFLVRATVLIAIALPYLMAVALTFRPKVVSRDDPATKLGMRFEPVQFQTSDGYNISGWWIPAAQKIPSTPPRSNRWGLPPVPTPASKNFGRDTVVICHGIGSNKAAVLNLARSLVPHGYNVLVFDFRGHGESDGQLTSLGDLERQDVLAAVHWLQDQHPRQARRILGLGVSTGAAALLAAAVDSSPAGQSIDAVAVFEGFDELRGLGRSVATSRFLPPLSWIADRVGLVLASAQVGTDLVHFSPANSIKQLWPRPLLVIHGLNDDVIPFEHGERLFEAAYEPKRRVWLTAEDYAQSLTSKEALIEVRQFFDEAIPVPAI
ncbi:MAG: alpha/beta fold hydrolase [Anaerolineae bacterium]|nr:alpha/beta fold hydrolase [Phycisphaerae bacterium]